MVLGKQFHQLCNCLQAISGAIELGQYTLAKRETERAIVLLVAARKIADGMSVSTLDWCPSEQSKTADGKS
jgi:hypothetical protein